MLLSQDSLPPGFWMHEDTISQGEATSYDIVTRLGKLNALFWHASRVYDINELHVERKVRHQGVGTQLMRVAVIHAEELHAEAIRAAITSRESYQLMKSVFGRGSISAVSVGKYAPEGMDKHPTSNTIANLWHDLGRESCKTASVEVD